MRSRMVREGSVGLFILLGLAIFGGLILWLRGFTFGKRSYKALIEFPNVGGLQAGASVRYRGVTVGRITDIQPNSNGVAVAVEITSPNVVIPRDGLLIETNQSGFIGETYVDMRPLKPLPPNVQGIRPLSSSCNNTLIVCDNSRLQGQVGPSIEELLRSTTRLANLYGDPQLYNNITAVAQKTAIAADQVTQLSRDVSGLTRSAQQELRNLSGSANSVSRAVNQTAYQAGLTVNKFGNTATQLSNTAAQFSNTATQYGQSAQQLNQLLSNVNTLVQRNRSTLESTLVNFSEASRQVVGTVNSLKTTLAQVNSTVAQVNSTVGRFNSAKLANNLEVLSVNAATASNDAAKAAANLRNFTNGLSTLNTRENLVQLQRTLDSAQAVFENARKITSDLDELTGDPNFRNNVRRLVNGLGKLVSSTQQLEQQVQVANLLAPITEKINTTVPNQVVVSQPQFMSQPLLSKPVRLWSNSLSAPASDNKATHTLPARKENQLKPVFQPSESPVEDWFVPDDQPESKD